MKRKFTKLMAALALLVLVTLPAVGWGQTRAEVVAYTLEPASGSNNGYNNNCDIEIDGITWNLTGNSQYQPWRIGGKNLTNVDRLLYSKTAIADNITKIEVTHGAASGITVNSWTVIVATDANFSSIVSTLTPTFTANATTTINRPDGADWSNCYYQFVYNVTVSGGSNRFIQFTRAKFYKQEGSGPVIATPTFSPAAGTYTETQSVTISCETQGASIYYTADGSTPDDTSTQYTGAITVSETTTINAIAYVGTDASSVASATYTIVNLEHAGTEADPYSVADARAAIDANVGITGVYATGIVSEIVTEYNSQYSNVTFDIVDEEGDEVYLRAYRCGGTEAANVAVNDVVIVSGNLIKYNSIYEFAEGCQLVSLTHPVVTTPSVTVTPATINAPAEGAEGILTVSYENITEVVAEVYFCDANGDEATYDWIQANIDNDNNVYYVIGANDGEARTAYFKVWAYADDATTEVYSNFVTVNQEEYVAPTYAELPFSFNGGKADIENTDGLYQEGLGTDYSANTAPNTKLKFDSTGDWLLLQFEERPGALTFYIKGNSFSGGTFKVQTSENGTTYTDLATYTELGDAQPVELTNLGENVRYIKWIYTNRSSGNVGLGNIALAKYVDPSTVPSIDASDVNLAYDDTNDYIVYEIDNYVDGTMSANTEATWISDIVVTPDPSDASVGEVTFSVTANNSTNSRSATVTLTYTYNTNQTVTKDVTVTQAGKPAVIIESPIQLTAAANDNGTIDVTYANFTPADKDIHLYDDQECTTDFSDDWFDASFATVSNVTDFNHIDYMVDANTGAARTVYMKVEVMDGDLNMVSTVVTINQAAYSAPGTWVQCNLTDLTPADVFVIVGNNGDTYAMSNNNGTGSAPSAVEVTVTNVNTLSEAPAATLQWNLAITDAGYVFYPAGSASTWLYCTNSNNGVRVGTGNAKHFTIDDSFGYLTTTETTEQRYIGVYQSSDWRCYKLDGNNIQANIANQTFSFFKKVSDNVSYSKQNIVAYSGTKDKYYLISSPVASVTPSVTNGFATAEYDLYAFDQNEVGAEWRNFEDQTTGGWNIVSGKGYLYASNTNTELAFTGQPYNGNGVVALDYTDGKTFAGWNLIGNPFANPATLNMPYYKMNDNGDGFTAKIEDLTNPVDIMEGVFVQATAANETATFTAQATGKGAKKSIAKVELMLNGNKGIIDNAIVRFDDGQTLEKFMLNANGTKLYFTENNKVYAIVRSNNEGEMPVSFKASANGTYTLSVNPENVEMNYLHLIDNMTGTDVDLLATPSYSFDARTTDYASRFKLVFKAGTVIDENTTTETFAFFNGSEWTVSNQGNATLQVIDMMGRVLSSETINGNANVNLNQTAGIYMLRLVNGNSVKVQKVVVK